MTLAKPLSASRSTRTAFWRRWALPLLLLALALGGWWYWSKSRAQAAAPQLLTAAVERGAIQDTVLASGTIQAAKMINVGAQVSGQVKRLHVKLGERVNNGQLVAEIDAATQNNSLQDAQAALTSAQAQRSARQAQLAQAQTELARQHALARQGFISGSALANAQTAVKTAQADLNAAQAQVLQFSVRAKTAQSNLGYTRIVAPMSGVVVAIVTDEGMTLNANQTAPTIIKLADLSTMTIQAQISEADVPRVKPGMAAFFTILGEPDAKYGATLRAIEPGPIDIANTSAAQSTSSNANAVYYNGLFDVPNPDGKLRIAMTAQVSIVMQEAQDALLIPAGALGKRAKDGSYTVRVATGKRGAQETSERTIRTGLNNRVQVQVLDGLREGEQVVVGDAANNTGGAQRPRGVRMF